MKNKKYWLYGKAVLILILTIVIFTMPVENEIRKWFRFIMLTYFVISFIVDLTRYKKNDA